MQAGLEDVVAAETVLSDVDGLRGRLIVRGYALHELTSWRFEAVAGLLFGGFFDALPDEAGFAAALGAARVRVFRHAAAIDADILALPVFEAMRALVARLPDGEDLETALDLLAAPAVFTAAVLRRKAGLAAIAPEAARGHAADMVRMLGHTPSEAAASALNTYLVTVADHGLNASTFAARVIASTRAGLTSSALAALSALKGPLHGGAPGPVLDMLDAIGTPQHAEAWLTATLDRGERLMGFGHRIYRVRDPRADALKAALPLLAAGGAIDPGRLRLAERVEAEALKLLKERKPDRPLDTNVEFFTAVLLEAIGVPREAFTAAFAAGRMAGWIAHSREQAQSWRIMRPQSTYVGPQPLVAA